MAAVKICSKPWNSNTPPKKILAIRFQALGDTVITLPYLQYLSEKYPNTQLDFLTRKETADIPKSIRLFNKVYVLSGGRNNKLILLHALLLLPLLLLQNYDIVLDLQNNKVSRIVRCLLFPKAWSEFDKFSPISAGERTRLTIEAAGLGKIDMKQRFQLKNKNSGINKLKAKKWDGLSELIVLNPAGFFKTRNWNIENYIAFVEFWLHKKPNTTFLLLGDNRINDKAKIVEEAFEGRVINLVNQTSVAEAFAVIQQVKFMLTEDSGLMHMAWTSGIPTLALFGSTRSDWSAPQGKYSKCFTSSDLECGCCMAAECKYGDVHCLTRYTPEYIVKEALLLLNKVSEA